MFALDAKRLLPADIIFTREKWSPTSIAIRTASISRFSHAILYVDAYSYIDSDGDGVHANNPQYNLFTNPSDIAVKRYKERLREDQVHRICDFARSEINKRYSVRDTLGTVIGFVPGESKAVDRQFCSRVVAMSYAEAGIKLVPNPLRCTPSRVYRSSDLIEVPKVCRPASDEDVALAQRHGASLLVKQEETTNKLMADVRAATNSSVETMTDIVRLAMERPETDTLIASVLTNSGYLFMWMEMRARSPYWYDAGMYAQIIPVEQQTEIADELYDSIIDALRRREVTANALSEAFSRYSRLTIALLLELERTLLNLEKERLTVVEQFRTKASS